MLSLSDDFEIKEIVFKSFNDIFKMYKKYKPDLLDFNPSFCGHIIYNTETKKFYDFYRFTNNQLDNIIDCILHFYKNNLYDYYYIIGISSACYVKVLFMKRKKGKENDK